ncbi:Putative G-protein coupled receptor [Sarcoptes scabiei]|uniref:Putative G-protein coupled receptor n=1 Tax=Sarcoptes scabiei TaxID=52283 RepID=A0A834R385_SARSC|nr:Putative G-protein coupled receptor [Sarcoptes scabiei]
MSAVISLITINQQNDSAHKDSLHWIRTSPPTRWSFSAANKSKSKIFHYQTLKFWKIFYFFLQSNFIILIGSTEIVPPSSPSPSLMSTPFSTISTSTSSLDPTVSPSLSRLQRLVTRTTKPIVTHQSRITDYEELFDWDPSLKERYAKLLNTLQRLHNTSALLQFIELSNNFTANDLKRCQRISLNQLNFTIDPLAFDRFRSEADIALRTANFLTNLFSFKNIQENVSLNYLIQNKDFYWSLLLTNLQSDSNIFGAGISFSNNLLDRLLPNLKNFSPYIYRSRESKQSTSTSNIKTLLRMNETIRLNLIDQPNRNFQPKSILNRREESFIREYNDEDGDGGEIVGNDDDIREQNNQNLYNENDSNVHRRINFNQDDSNSATGTGEEEIGEEYFQSEWYWRFAYDNYRESIVKKWEQTMLNSFEQSKSKTNSNHQENIDSRDTQDNDDNNNQIDDDGSDFDGNNDGQHLDRSRRSKGFWSSPFLDCGITKTWLITYIVPFYGIASNSPILIGVVFVSIDLQQFDVNQCLDSGSFFSNTHKCHTPSTQCQNIAGLGFRSGSYVCKCRQGYYYPNAFGKPATVAVTKATATSTSTATRTSRAFGLNFGTKLTLVDQSNDRSYSYLNNGTRSKFALFFPTGGSSFGRNLIKRFSIFNNLNNNVDSDQQSISSSSLPSLPSSSSSSSSSLFDISLTNVFDGRDVERAFIETIIGPLIVPSSSSSSSNLDGDSDRERNRFHSRNHHHHHHPYLDHQESSEYFYPHSFICLPCDPGCQDCDDNSPCSIKFDQTFRLIILTIQIIGIVSSIIIAFLIFRLRYTKLVASSRWIMLETFLFGAILLYLTVIIRCHESNTITCFVEPWFREIGFAFCYGSIVIKVYRIYAEFQTRKAHRVCVQDKDLLKYLFGIVLIVFGYMSAWTALVIDGIDNFRSIQLFGNSFNFTSRNILDEKFNENGLKFSVCRKLAWDYVTEIGELLFLLSGVYLTYRIRNAKKEIYKEKLTLTVSILLETIVSFTTYIIRHLFWSHPNLHPDHLLLLYAIRCQITITTTIIILFMPKFFYKKPKRHPHNRSRYLSSAEVSDMLPDALHSAILSNGEFDIGEINLSDMDPEDIRSELRRVYTQLQVLKNKTIRKDNPHISKRRGGRKSHRRFSLQPFHHKHKHDPEITEISKTPEESTASIDGTTGCVPDGPSITKNNWTGCQTNNLIENSNNNTTTTANDNSNQNVSHHTNQDRYDYGGNAGHTYRSSSIQNRSHPY